MRVFKEKRFLVGYSIYLPATFDCFRTIADEVEYCNFDLAFWVAVLVGHSMVGDVGGFEYCMIFGCISRLVFGGEDVNKFRISHVILLF